MRKGEQFKIDPFWIDTFKGYFVFNELGEGNL